MRGVMEEKLKAEIQGPEIRDRKALNAEYFTALRAARTGFPLKKWFVSEPLVWHRICPSTKWPSTNTPMGKP